MEERGRERRREETEEECSEVRVKPGKWLQSHQEKKVSQEGRQLSSTAELSSKMTTRIQSRSGDSAETKKKKKLRGDSVQDIYVHSMPLVTVHWIRTAYFLSVTTLKGVDQRMTMKMARGIVFLVLRDQLRN